MGEDQEKSLRDLFELKFDRQTKKFNLFITSVIALMAIFAGLVITFMVNSSKKDGIQDTQIAQIVLIQLNQSNQIEKLADATDLLVIDKEVKQAEYKSLLKILTETNEMAQKTEWAVLTGDKSIITRSKTKK